MNIKPKVTPIYQTSVFTFDDLNDLEAYYAQPDHGYMYTRYENPNSDEFAALVSDLEGGAGAVTTSSGTSALLAGISTLCQSGDHVLCSEEIYGGSAHLLSNELNNWGLSVTYVPMDALYNLDPYIQDNTKVLLTETISNPILQVQDIKRLAEACHQHSIKLMIDNTFATPVMTRPFDYGADMVIHSATKFLSGHSDVTAGIVVLKEQEDLTRVKKMVGTYGLNVAPFESWLAARSMKTLKIRMKQHCQNAALLARFLESHPKVKEVFYPGLESNSNYDLAKEQGNEWFGGLVTFRLKDDLELINTFMRSLQQIPFSPSLAGVTTSISHPLTTSHRALPDDVKSKLGITMGLIRLSVGIEDVEDIQTDLDQALGKL